MHCTGPVKQFSVHCLLHCLLSANVQYTQIHPLQTEQSTYEEKSLSKTVIYLIHMQI